MKAIDSGFNCARNAWFTGPACKCGQRRVDAAGERERAIEIEIALQRLRQSVVLRTRQPAEIQQRHLAGADFLFAEAVFQRPAPTRRGTLARPSSPLEGAKMAPPSHKVCTSASPQSIAL